MKAALRQSQAFTLLELMIVLVIVAVLALSALPAFRLASSADVFQERNQLQWLVLHVQQRSMQDTAQLATQCPSLVLNTHQIGQANQQVCQANATFSYASDDPRQLQLAADHYLQGLTFPTVLRFDSWGRPTGACAAGCELQIRDGANVAKLCIATTGYVDAC